MDSLIAVGFVGLGLTGVMFWMSARNRQKNDGKNSDSGSGSGWNSDSGDGGGSDGGGGDGGGGGD